MIIKSNTKTYTVHIQKDFCFFDNLKREINIYFVIDKNVYKMYYEKLFSDIPAELVYLIDALETNKRPLKLLYLYAKS